MKRALVLSSGAAWAAYQIGALDYLVDERGIEFDVCAGTGIGAMNAAFVACGEFGALKEFWSDIGWMNLLSVNWNSPLKKGFFTGKPQKDFIQRYINVEKLEKQNSTLVFNSLNIATGQQQYFDYPGTDMPLIETLMAAVSVPGMSSPLQVSNGALVEGTFANSFILDYIITKVDADEYYGVAANPAGTVESKDIKIYANWREAMYRTLQLNLSRDISIAIKTSRNKLQVLTSKKNLRSEIERKISEDITDENAKKQLLKCVQSHYENKSDQVNQPRTPSLYTIITEKEIESPLWSFKKKYVKDLMNRGYLTAKKIVS